MYLYLARYVINLIKRNILFTSFLLSITMKPFPSLCQINRLQALYHDLGSEPHSRPLMDVWVQHPLYVEHTQQEHLNTI